MTPFRLEIITPEKTFFDGNTEQIIARTTVGDVGILNGHEPYCAALGIGQMRVMIDGKFRRAATSGGIIKVSWCSPANGLRISMLLAPSMQSRSQRIA